MMLQRISITSSGPDLPGCTTTGATEDEALEHAREAMSLHLWGMEVDEDEIPAPTPLHQLDLGEYLEEGEKIVAVLVEVWMPSFRERMETKAVNRTVTLPGWLDSQAKRAALNYSQILQDGIMEAPEDQQEGCTAQRRAESRRWCDRRSRPRKASPGAAVFLAMFFRGYFSVTSLPLRMT